MKNFLKKQPVIDMKLLWPEIENFAARWQPSTQLRHAAPNKGLLT